MGYNNMKGAIPGWAIIVTDIGRTTPDDPADQ